jgi:hypothetical protein
MLSRRITAAEALRVQQDAIANGDLLIWTVCDHPTDAPEWVTARPYSVRNCGALDCVLAAATRDEVRTMLPIGLSRLERDPADDPVIVEVWL